MHGDLIHIFENYELRNKQSAISNFHLHKLLHTITLLLNSLYIGLEHPFYKVNFLY